MKRTKIDIGEFSGKFKEIVFGMEDGMVSTLGALTGVAIGSLNAFTVLLTGLVIITVESISMGVGSYISTKSSLDITKRSLKEKKLEIFESPQKQKELLQKIYIKDGWPKTMAGKMAMTAAKNKKMFFQEMTFHGLRITSDSSINPIKNGLFMFISYIIGGSIPLIAYFFLPIKQALIVSVIITLIGLFCLGVGTSRFTKRTWWKSGFELLTLAGIAALAGYFIGYYAELFLNK